MKQLLLVATLISLAGQSLAFNAPGHHCVNYIAWQLLDSGDRERAISLLADHPRFDQHFIDRMPDKVWQQAEQEQQAWIFCHAGAWADIVRSKSATVSRDDVRRFNRPTWHYINLHIFLSPADRTALAGKLTNNRSVTPPEDRDDRDQNVAQAIASNLSILRDSQATRRERAVALCWFLHLVGDAHQPCHSSALYSAKHFPKGDRGGNSIPVAAPGRNLHAFWDQAILPRRADFTRVRRAAVEHAGRYQQDGIVATEDLEPKAWLVESWWLAQEVTYSKAILEAITDAESADDLDSIQLGEDYFRAAGATVHRRAVEAGHRIAAILADSLPASDGDDPIFRRPAIEPVPLAATPRAETPAASETRFWLNTNSNVRHNSSCKWFGKTKRGHYCDADDGKPCSQCGG